MRFLVDECTGPTVAKWLRTRETNCGLLHSRPQSCINCGKCDMPTRMVFATRVAEAVKCAGDCSSIEKDKREKLKNYTRRFKLDD